MNKTPYLWIGIGAQSSVSRSIARAAICTVVDCYRLDLADIIGLATLDRKAIQLDLDAVCRESGWLLKTYPPNELTTITSARASQLALDVVGTASIAEAAALLAAQTDRLLVPKQKYRPHDRSGWMTIAIAQAAVIE